jgi:RimJ/RimL family protein N-acetyltransferase
VIIETERLLLEPCQQRHLAGFVRLAADECVMRYIGSGVLWSREESEERFAWHLDHWRRHGFGWRSATDRSSGALVGFVGINHVRPDAIEVDHGEVEIGWRFAPSATGRGLATEGSIALRDEGFGRVGLQRLIGRCQPGNGASVRVIEKIGMRLERDARGRHGERIRIYCLDREGGWRSLPPARQPHDHDPGAR